MTTCVLLPLQLLDIRAGLREHADAAAVRRPPVQVEGQVRATAQPSRPGASWDGSEVIDPQEVSRLRRQHKPGASLSPAPSEGQQVETSCSAHTYQLITCLQDR